MPTPPVTTTAPVAVLLLAVALRTVASPVSVEVPATAAFCSDTEVLCDAHASG